MKAKEVHSTIRKALTEYINSYKLKTLSTLRTMIASLSRNLITAQVLLERINEVSELITDEDEATKLMLTYLFLSYNLETKIENDQHKYLQRQYLNDDGNVTSRKPAPVYSGGLFVVLAALMSHLERDSECKKILGHLKNENHHKNSLDGIEGADDQFISKINERINISRKDPRYEKTYAAYFKKQKTHKDFQLKEITKNPVIDTSTGHSNELNLVT